ncbi:MAG: ABC transporter permease, partial [Cyanobacteria bacterium REEB65]|nr:ABC transporter permease [Cyanobacteria bacterium REEB65]
MPAAAAAISSASRAPGGGRTTGWRLAPWILLAAVVVMAILANRLTPYDPLTQFRNGLDPNGMPLPPQRAHWLGTDDLGRDVWCRLLYGARISLTVGFSATLMTGTLGVGVGLAAGYLGGKIDLVLMRITEIFMAFPILLLAIGLAVVLPPRPEMVVLTLGLVGWPSLARLIRAQAMALRDEEYVLAARSIGARELRIVTRHVLPNLAGQTATLLALKLADML